MRDRRSAVDQLEDAVVLLASQSARVWLTYLGGMVPWLLGLLFFAEDMLNGDLSDHCLPGSLLLVLLFYWLSVSKARFAGLLLASIGGEQSRTSRSTFQQCLFVQLLFQSLKLITFPLAIVSILPLGWVSSFFRNVNIEANQPGLTLKTVARRAASHASADPVRYWNGLLILFLIALVVFFNLFVGAALLPELLKTVTGFENAWTRNAHNIVNLNFLSIVLGAAWLLLDPLFQAFSVVQFFYSEAGLDGRDLLLQLRRLAIAGVCLLLFLLPLESAPARPLNPSRSLSAADLSRAIRNASRDPEFAWQAPRVHAKGPAERTLEAMNENISRVQSAVAGWLRKFLSRPPQRPAQTSMSKHAPTHLSAFLALIGALLILAVLFALMRSARKANAFASKSAGIAEPSDLLLSENILPSDLPEDEWLHLARRCLAAGDRRSAIRAFYLSNLAFLGSRRLITLAKSKTNGIYEREIRRRSTTPELYRAFINANRDYEKAWYGLHEATLELTDASENHTQAIRQHV